MSQNRNCNTLTLIMLTVVFEGCHYFSSFGFVLFSSQQLTIKEFYLKVIPKRLFTFRVCPSTKVKKISFTRIFNFEIKRIIKVT